MRELLASEISGVAGGSATPDPNSPWLQFDKGPSTEGLVGAGLMSAVCSGTGGLGAVLCGIGTYVGVELAGQFAARMDSNHPAPTLTTPDGTTIAHNPQGVLGIQGNGYTDNSVVGGVPGGLPSSLSGNGNP